MQAHALDVQRGLELPPDGLSPFARSDFVSYCGTLAHSMGTIPPRRYGARAAVSANFLTHATPTLPSAMTTRYRILVTDDIDREGVDLLASEPGLQVDSVPTLPSAELIEKIGDYDALIGRSATRISEELLRRAGKLRVVGRAGVGIDNIALNAAFSASSEGAPVM